MRGKKKILSLLLSLAMLFTTFFTQAGTAFAVSQQNGVNRTNAVKSLFTNTKDVDYQRALNQKYGVKISNEGIVTNKNLQGKINPDDKVRVIVQINGPSTLQIAQQKHISAKAALVYENSVKAQQANVVNAVKKFGTIRYTYQNALNGLSAVVKYKDIGNLRKIPGVVNVSVANMYTLDTTSGTPNGVDLTNANTVWTNPGLKGEGTVVAIVDTGIDYTHKDMKLTDPSKAKLTESAVEAIGGPGKYFTAKVPYGYNFADQNDQVIPQASEHGMHVAGIVAANASDQEVASLQGVKGVAPEAQLLAMKVFSNNPNFPSAYNDDIAAAIDDSVKHGADVINMSLGSTAGFVDLNDPEQLAIKNATDAGVVVSVSAGNSYYSSEGIYNPYTLDQDMSTVGAPGLNPDTICVASYENTEVVMPAFDYSIGSETGLMGYTTSEVNPLGTLSGEYSLVYCGFGQTSDIFNADGSPKVDLKGKIALIQRGAISFVEKKQNAQKAGAAGVIVFNNAGDAYINMATDPSVKIPGIFISQTDGEKLLNNIDKAQVSFNGKVTSVPNANAGQMSDFSSWGTTPGLGFKPEVTAPGGQIYSTIPDNKYETMSGTSMASPNIAGSTALVVEHLNQLGIKNDGRNFVNLAKDLIINSAQPIIDPATGSAKLPYLTRKQGAGLVQVDRAVTTNAYVTDGTGSPTIALKEIGNTTTFKLDITNFGSKDLTFNLKDNYGVLTNNVISGIFLDTSATNIKGASVAFDKNSVTVPAGGSAEVSVTLSIPTTTTNNIFAEGFITLVSNTPDQPNLGIPYMGFYGKWSGQDGPRMFDAPIWDGSNYYGETTLVSGDGSYLGQTGKDQYGNPVVNPQDIAFSPNGDGVIDSVMPQVSFMRNAKSFEIQILDSNGNVVRTIAQDENITKNYTDQQTFYATTNNDWAWDGTIYDQATGKFVVAPEGNYTVRLIGTPDFDNAQPYILDMPVKLDVTAPTLQVTSSPELTDVNSYNLTWTGSDNTGISDYLIFVDNSTTPVADLSSDKNSYTLNLPNGAKTVTLMAVDYAGNTTSKTVDLENNLINVENLQNNSLINTRDLTVNYTLSDSIKLFVDHVDVIVDGDTPVSQDRNATSFDVNGLSDGKHQIVFNAYGTNEKLLATNTINFTVDATKPIITKAVGIDSEGNSFTVESGASLTIRQFTLEAAASEPLSSATVNGVNAKILPDTDADGNKISDIVVPVEFTSDGPDRLSFNIVDLAGNVNNYEYKLFVDTEPPVLTVYPNDDNVTLGNSDSTYNVTINAQDETGYRLYVNGEQIGYAQSPVGDGSGTSKTFEYSYNVPAGKSVLKIEAVDFNGFSSEKDITFQRTVDAPLMTITSPIQNQEVQGNTVTVKGNITDDNPLQSVTINGKAVSLDVNGNFTQNVTFTNYGANTVTVTATDSKERTTTENINVTTEIPYVTSIALAADNTAIERGQKAAITATATYSDGSTADVTNTATWAAEKGSVDKGIFTAPTDYSGDVTVTASLGNVSGTTVITVNVPHVTAIALTADNTAVERGQRATIAAIATYSDGSTADVTNTATWTAEKGSVVNGVFTAPTDYSGDVAVTASLSGVSATTTINVKVPHITAIALTADNTAVERGQKAAITATATYSDGSTADVTNTAAWTAEKGSVVNGVFTAPTDYSGNVVVTASLSGVSATTTINIKVPHITAIALTLDSTAVERGQKAVITATATYSDGSTADVTNTAVWTAEKGSVVNGVFTAPTDYSGNVVVTASLSGVSAAATINVKVPSITRIDVAATLQGLVVGKTSTLKATATYSDGTVNDVTSSVTWKVSNTNLGKITGNVFTALAAGDVDVQAVLGNTTSGTVKMSIAAPATVVKKIITILAYRLNVRTGDSTSYSRIGSLSRGQVIEYSGILNGWYRISYNGRLAYVCGSYVRAGETTVYNNNNTMTGTVTAYLLNVRAGASFSARRLGGLRRNTTVTILESLNGWYKISYNGGTAYVCASFVKVNGTSVSSTSTRTGTVTAYLLNVRAGASFSARRLGGLRRNTTVTILESLNGWYKISYNGGTAYVYAAYVK